jgi:hypothetical protein
VANNELAYGFASLSQFLSERSSTVGLNVISDALRASSAEWTRSTNELLSLLAERTTVAQERYLLPGSGSLQKLDEFGVPLVVVPSGYYDVAFPIDGGGTAYGRNRVTRVIETVADINRDQLDAEMKDAVWLRNHLLAALLDNTTRTWIDPQFGTLTVRPLALTSDGVTYLRTGGTATTAQHYVAQTADIEDATNPYTVAYTALSAHPSNAGRTVVTFIPPANAAKTLALTSFYDVTDPNIIYGADSDRLAANGDQFRGMGEKVLGYVSNQWIVQWGALPDNYLLSLVVGRPPLAMREHADPALQGLFPEIHSPDGARLERRYIRYAGFGVRNRISAFVTQVNGGDTTYDIPTGYAAPRAA